MTYSAAAARSRGNQPALARRMAARRTLAALLTLTLLLPGCFVLPRGDRHGLKALNADETLAGAWLGQWPSDRAPLIQGFEKRTGIRLHLVDVYLDWYTPFQNVSHTLTHIANHGALAILTWEAQGITTRDILDGSLELPLRNGQRMALDAYLEEFSRGVCDAARLTGQPILVRILHEMNGHWFAWGISYMDEQGTRPNSPDTYRKAFIKIHDAFTSRCGDSVRFVWAVNHSSVGEGTSFMGAYPGDAYVDFVGIDGYNWGGRAEWGWQSFETLFRDAYCAVTKASERPILIAETASTEKGGDKAAWIRDLFDKFRQYPRLRGFVYFNDAKYEVEIQGNMDWPIDSSPQALEAFSQGAESLLTPRETAADADPPVQTVRC